MKKSILLLVTTFGFIGSLFAQAPPKAHPQTSGKGWVSLFKPDLSNAGYPAGVWSVTKGELTATEDKWIWTTKQYKNFVLDLEFKTAQGTNSGVIVYCTDTANWISNSVEIQIADDYSEEWSKAAPTWQCAAIFGRLSAKKHQVVKKPGEWNHYTITCQGQKIWIMLNGQMVTEMDMSKWTSGSKNPDGSDIPSWLNKPLAELPTHGVIGFQGKHAGAPIWFRNIKIKELK
ncbi:MAG: DUF1080 domain-containing protein [Bacteroidota bacterium]